MSFSHYRPRFPADPRYYQITVLAGLLGYGMGHLDFGVDLRQLAVIIPLALGTQYLATRIAGLPRFDPLSALISSLSLCLLLRAGSPAALAGVTVLTIAGKFVLRWNHKHVFNPVNFGLVAGMLLSEQVWVSPGQWGNAALFGFLLACLGGLVVNRAARADIVFAFLLSYAAVLFGRALWLGDPWAIPWHQMQNGAFLLFTFFMISDPKTSPDSRLGRIVFAALVAVTAGYFQFVLYKPTGLLWALACCAPSTPVLDWLLPGRRYVWPVKFSLARKF